MPDSLDSIRKQVRDRMKELQPLVEEYQQLERAIGALEGRAAAERQQAAQASGGRRRGAGGGGGARRGRPRGSGTRAQQALDLVRAKPGMTIPELAEAMGIKQNYLYRVMPALAKENLVHKSGRGWHVREGAPAEAPESVEEVAAA